MEFSPQLSSPHKNSTFVIHLKTICIFLPNFYFLLSILWPCVASRHYPLYHMPVLTVLMIGAKYLMCLCIFQSFFGFGQSADIEIQLDGSDTRKMAEMKTEDGKKERYYLYYDGESVSGKVSTVSSSLLS